MDLREFYGGCTAWRIIPVSKRLVTPIYKPFRPFGRGPTTLLRGRTLTMVTKWDDPPSVNPLCFLHFSRFFKASLKPNLFLHPGLDGLEASLEKMGFGSWHSSWRSNKKGTCRVSRAAPKRRSCFESRIIWGRFPI